MMVPASQPGWCRRRRAATAESDSTQCKGYTSRAERSAGFSKTRLCKFFLEGKCTRGKKCTFAHGEEDKEEQSQPVCMKLCKTLIATGRCKNQNCRYAHSKEEIVSVKQLTAGLVNSQLANGSADAAPPESGQLVGQPVQLTVGQPVQLPASQPVQPVRWFGFLCNIRWVCPQRASRVIGAPPGVLEPPAANSAVSFPVMQMTSSELPATHQLEGNSCSVSPEPEFHVVVKNTFIDIVEKSPRSIHRSRSEPPRFTCSDLDKRPRCQTAIEDVAVSFAEQKCSEFDCLPEETLAPGTPMVEPSEVSPCTSQLEHPIQEQSIEGGVHLATEVKTFGGEESVAFANLDFPAFEVRNTFIELRQGLPKAETLRPVRSDPDLLALEREAIHQAQN